MDICRSNEGRKVGQEEKQKRWRRKKDAYSRKKKKKKEREIRGTKAEKASNFFTLNYQTT